MLPEGWFPIDDIKDQMGFAAELEREMCAGHKLYGLKSRAIARCSARDDFIFEVEGRGWAFVHLTWSKETQPEWPDSEIFISLEECVAAISSDQ